jgi:small basic protein
LGGLLLGVVLGLQLPIMPLDYVQYMAVAVLAALDSVAGGIRAYQEHIFDTTIFVTGFCTNTVLAAFLAYLGDLMGLDLYLAAVFAFGVRLFQNIGIIRRLMLKKIR